MTRVVALLAALAVAACAPQSPAVGHDPVAPKFRTCQALSPALPRVRTVEALNARLAELEAKYPDCAERLRQAVEAHDALKARK